MFDDVIHFYRVDDLDKAKWFFSDVLGLELYKDQGQCLIFNALDHGKIGCCLHFPSQPISQSCITFVYPSRQVVDQLHQRLIDQGLNPTTPAFNTDFHIYHFFMKDPNQLTIEFQVFEDEGRMYDSDI